MGGDPAEHTVNSASRTWAAIVGPPLIAFLSARLLFSAAAHSAGVAPLTSESWSRWDSDQYIDIAMRGYEVVPCAGIPWLTCGNTGWMPGLSYAIRALMAIGLEYYTAGAAVSAAFSLGFMIVVWSTWLGCELSIRSGLVLIALAVAPGAVYQQATYPISMVLFFAAIEGVALERRWWGIAAICCAASAFSYSTGFLTVASAVSAIMLDRELPLRARSLGTVLVLGGTVLGLGLVALAQAVEAGRWDGFLAVQDNYGHGLSNPLLTLYALTGPDVSRTLEANLLLVQPEAGAASIVRAHVLASLGFVSLALAGAVLSARHGGPRRDRWAALHVGAFALFPLLMGPGVAPIRAESLLAPATVLLRWLPRPAIAAWVVFAAWLAYRVARLYFSSQIV